MPKHRVLLFMAALFTAAPFVNAGGTISARAAGVSQPSACTGDWLGGGYDQTTQQVPIHATLICGTDISLFGGSATSPAPVPLCPAAGPASLVFTGTQSTDGGPPVAASWSTNGASGLYVLTAATADGQRWSGALVDDPTSFAFPSGVGCSSGSIVATQSPESKPAPEVLACRAKGTVGPNVENVAPSPGPGFPPASNFAGPAQGSGICQSAQGTWKLAYTGQWIEPGPNNQPACPGRYEVTVTATNQATKQSVQQFQAWFETSTAQGRAIRVQSFLFDAGYNPLLQDLFDPGITGGEGLPIGAGTIQESPDPCTFPSNMTNTTNWAFLLPS